MTVRGVRKIKKTPIAGVRVRLDTAGALLTASKLMRRKPGSIAGEILDNWFTEVWLPAQNPAVQLNRTAPAATRQTPRTGTIGY